MPIWPIRVLLVAAHLGLVRDDLSWANPNPSRGLSKGDFPEGSISGGVRVGHICTSVSLATRE